MPSRARRSRSSEQNYRTYRLHTLCIKGCVSYVAPALRSDARWPTSAQTIGTLLQRMHITMGILSIHSLRRVAYLQGGM